MPLLAAAGAFLCIAAGGAVGVGLNAGHARAAAGVAALTLHAARTTAPTEERPAAVASPATEEPAPSVAPGGATTSATTEPSVPPRVARAAAPVRVASVAPPAPKVATASENGAPALDALPQTRY
jgi:hypothetical protein